MKSSISLFFWLLSSDIHAWTPRRHPPSKPAPTESSLIGLARKDFLHAGSCLAVSFGGWSFLPVDAASAATTPESNANDNLFADLMSRSNLPTTAENDKQPPIPLPTSALSSQTSLENVQALLYLKDPRSEIRPMFTDTLTVTVRTIDRPDTVLAGAKIPGNVLLRQQLPLQLRLTKENGISSASAANSAADSKEQGASWIDALSNQDLLVVAEICTEDATSSVKSSASSPGCPRPSMTARGIAKFLELGSTKIRAAASLALEATS